MYILTSLSSTLFLIQLLQFCAGGNSNDVGFNIGNNKIYPWLVRIKDKEPKNGDSSLCYGTLITYNAVITRQECLLLKVANNLIVESFGGIIGDYITSNVSVLIKEDNYEAFLKEDDPTVILILEKSFNSNYAKPINIANYGTINKRDCFFSTWPSENPSEASYKIDLLKSTHNVHVWNDIGFQTRQFNRDVINAITRYNYYRLLRLQMYSDYFISAIEGSSLVCSLQQDPKKYVLVGITPGYLFSICKSGQNDCLSVLYFINLIDQADEITAKIYASSLI